MSQDARLKRQLLRWLIHKQAPVTADILDVLRETLQDADWEVRVTAMFAAGRLGASQVRSLVDRTPIPAGTKEGLDSRDRNTLIAARQIIVAQLNGLLTPERFESTIARMPGVPLNFARAVVGVPVDQMTRESLFITALTTPADTQAVPPETLPAGVVPTGDRYFLGDTEIELMWIAPLPHWLGDDPECLPTPNPIRLVAPSCGFFIARTPISALSPGEHSLEPEYLTATFDAAQRLCEGFSELTGVTVTLPAADHWEMAARGPDGRRYPSGNGFEENLLRDSSPWGVDACVGLIPQWTSSTNENGVPLICGNPTHLRCAARNVASTNQTAAIRPIVQLDTF